MKDSAVLFPGQGSQEIGMGRDMAENSPHARECMALWKQAERISGLPLRGICWDGDEAALADTRALQIALTVVHLNVWRLLAGRIQPLGVAGHSLGEYSALAAAGALSVDSVLKLTALRGRLMAEADQDGRGAMAAVLKLEQPLVQDLVRQSAESVGEILLVANYNTPGQYVVSGTRAALDHFLPKVKEHKGRALPLKVSGAFHSPLMDEAARELAGVLRKMQWNTPRCAVYCNVHGRPVTDADSLREAVLVQMTSSVRWIDTIRSLWADGARHFVELGPKAVLAKMVAPCLEGIADKPYAITITNEAEAVAFMEYLCVPSKNSTPPCA